MQKTFLIFVGLIILLLLGFSFFEFALPFFSPANAKLSVTNPKVAAVYLDGKMLGKTPFNGKNLRSGDHELLVKADDLSWKGTITLTSETLTVAEFDLAPGLFSSGDILNFKKGSTQLLVVSRPSGAEVSLDEKIIGKTPLNKDLSAGVHTLKMTKKGYLARNTTLNVEPGFTLKANEILSVDPFLEISKIDSSPKLSLFQISNSEVDLSSSYQNWAQGVKKIQSDFAETETKFDFLIDPGGKTYILDEDSWNSKLREKSSANIGFLSKKKEDKITPKAQQEWEKLKNTFD